MRRCCACLPKALSCHGSCRELSAADGFRGFGRHSDTGVVASAPENPAAANRLCGPTLAQDIHASAALARAAGALAIGIAYSADRCAGGVVGTTGTNAGTGATAMACGIAALKASGPVLITEAEAINKSYTHFFDHLLHLGGKVEIG